MSYRASRQASTKHSPFFILYQEEMRLPIDVNIMPTGQSESLEDEVHDDLDNTLHALLEPKKALSEKLRRTLSMLSKSKRSYLLQCSYIHTGLYFIQS